jgi:hypothetical protein
MTELLLCSLLDIWFPVGAEDFSFLHDIYTDSGTHPTSSLVGKGKHFPDVK